MKKEKKKVTKSIIKDPDILAEPKSRYPSKQDEASAKFWAINGAITNLSALYTACDKTDSFLYKTIRNELLAFLEIYTALRIEVFGLDISSKSDTSETLVIT